MAHRANDPSVGHHERRTVGGRQFVQRRPNSGRELGAAFFSGKARTFAFFQDGEDLGELFPKTCPGLPTCFAHVVFHQVATWCGCQSKSFANDGRGLAGTGEGAGHDAFNPQGFQRPRGDPGLFTSSLGEHGIKVALEDPRGIPLGLAVAEDEQAGRHAYSVRRR